MTGEEREYWSTECLPPPVGETGKPVFVPVRPGFGQTAGKTGCEDEWIDAMESRYGGQW
jgi:hypothetical protein